MHTYNSSLRYMMTKKDAKPRLIHLVLLLQEFNFKVKDRKGTENQVVDYLSQLEDEVIRDLGEKAEINDTFPDEHVLASYQDLILLFEDFEIFLASDIIPLDLSFHQRKTFIHDVSSFGRIHTYKELRRWAYSALCVKS